jgi:hypothetical protein
MMRVLLVAGRFDDQGGRPSGYAKKLGRALAVQLPSMSLATANGGHVLALPTLFKTIEVCDVVLWMPDVPNDVPKMVDDIKKAYPRKLLVTSKRNLTEDSYSLQDVVTRALAVKSNLVLMVSGARDRVLGTVLDPLGVVYCHEQPDVETVAKALADRVTKLTTFTRVPSRSVGAAIEVPSEAEFFGLIRDHAERFHEIIHGVNHERMLGNASFRCARGFPSFKREGLIFVSRRNVDKRFIGPEAFVATELADDGSVAYYGDIKPSVDTPIQLRLYDALPDVNYMLHSHTYVEGATFTDEPVPCGAIEEVDQILLARSQHRRSCDFAINVLGHGSIYFAKDCRSMRDIPWIPRPIPEVIGG